MDLYLFVSPRLHSIITIFFILILVPSFYSQEYERYMNCTRPYECGTTNNVQYPLWGNDRPQFCGHNGFKLNCVENEYSVIDIAEMKFRVLEINQLGHTMTIARMDLWDDVCTSDYDKLINITLNYSLFDYTGTNQNLLLFYDCWPDDLISVPYNNCSKKDYPIFYVNDSLLETYGKILFEKCQKSIIVPVLNSNLDQLWSGSLKLLDALNRGFDVEYDAIARDSVACESSDGLRVHNSTFLCLCGDTTHSLTCQKSDIGMSLRKKLSIGVAAGGIGTLFLCIIICCFRRKTSSLTSMPFLRKITKNDQDLEAVIRSYGTMALKRYSFSRIKKMTNSFKDKLGQGGYGDAYKGMMIDSRLVAVKILNASKGNGEEFINEVASISRTSHINC